MSLNEAHLTFKITPAGRPTDTAAEKELCSDTFFSALHSISELIVPTLERKEYANL
jgi:hypothetical protein